MFNMENCNPARTPVECGIALVKDAEEGAVDPTLFKQIVGCLRYLCNSRLDIAYVAGLVSRLMEDPKVSHLCAIKMILRYVKGTLDFGLLFTNNRNPNKGNIGGFIDSDWSGDKDGRKSISGYFFSYATLLFHGPQRNSQL